MKSTSLSTKLIMILLLLAVVGYFAVQGYNYLVSPETTTLVYRYRSEQSIAVRGCVCAKSRSSTAAKRSSSSSMPRASAWVRATPSPRSTGSAEALSATQELESLARAERAA